jgi:multisubunit Na+/H+ antiporter MnhG subunit
VLPTLLAASAVVAILLACLAVWRTPRVGGRWPAARILLWTGLAQCLAVAAVMAAEARPDLDWITVALLSVPVLGAGAPVLADLAGRSARLVTAAGALVVFCFAMVFGLGPAIYLVVPTLLIGFAAALRTGPASPGPHLGAAPRP